MWSMLEFVVQRKRVLWSSWILNECNLSCKIVKNCRIIGLNRVKKNKFYPTTVWLKKGLIVLFTRHMMRKSMFRRLVYTPPDSSPITCKVNLLNTKMRSDFLFWGLSGLPQPVSSTTSVTILSSPSLTSKSWRHIAHPHPCYYMNYISIEEGKYLSRETSSWK